jgi:hypothetical protein
VAFINSQALYRHLFTILRDWEIQKLDRNAHQPAVITIEKTDAGFLRQSRWLSKPAIFRHPVDAVCDFIVDLIHAYVADNSGLLCLHCAAVESRQGLVVFPNTYRAGKSTLSLKLVSCGGRLFTDDVLPIPSESEDGLALGILPRLRLPLPDTAGQAFVDFVSQRGGPKNGRYLYIKLNGREQAAFGTTAPIRWIIILQRDGAAKPALMKTEKNIVMKDILLRNFARQNPALEIVERLHTVVEQAECCTLRYATLDQAANLLEEAVGLQTG